MRGSKNGSLFTEEPPEWKPGTCMDPLSPGHLVLFPQVDRCELFPPVLWTVYLSTLSWLTDQISIGISLVYFQNICFEVICLFVRKHFVLIFGLVCLLACIQNSEGNLDSSI